jgi:hypothetical protein
MLKFQVGGHQVETNTYGCSTRVGSSLTLKKQTILQVSDGDKHSSLVRTVTNTVAY